MEHVTPVPGTGVTASAASIDGGDAEFDDSAVLTA